MLFLISSTPQGGSTRLGRFRLALANLACALGDFEFSTAPHFLWVTEFPLFTKADADKDFLAHGRWSSTHHPFTAPMWEDIEKMYAGQFAEVCKFIMTLENILEMGSFERSALIPPSQIGPWAALRPRVERYRDRRRLCARARRGHAGAHLRQDSPGVQSQLPILPRLIYRPLSLTNPKRAPSSIFYMP